MINQPQTDDVGRRVLLKVLDDNGKTLWSGEWELFGIRYDLALVLRNINTGKIIEIAYNPELIKVVGPKMSGA